MGSVRYKVGNIVSSDVFYSDNPDAMAAWQKMGVLACEMEAAGLYMTGEVTTSEERQSSFHDMMKIALEIA